MTRTRSPGYIAFVGNQIVKLAFEYGILGVAVLVLAVSVRTIYGHARDDRKVFDREREAFANRLSEEQALRVSDAQRFTKVALQLQADVISAVAAIEKSSEENAKLYRLVEKLVEQVDEFLILLRRRRD